MKTSLRLLPLCVLAGLLLGVLPARAAQTDIPGPPGSGKFGATVTYLPNGNFVVTDPEFSLTTPTAVATVGAVYLYNGATLALISTLTGSTEGDAVGEGGITVLSNGNYVVRSPGWNGSRGAVTWGSATTGVSGTVSADNSLVGVGGAPPDRIGYVSSGASVIVLNNGNYVVRSPFWSSERGAVTWGNGAQGTVGEVSPANSLVGGTAGDKVGNNGVFALNNGNYVVATVNWDNGTAFDAGAVTWGSGTAGVKGTISAANSLVGSKLNDAVGSSVTVLANGNYVVGSRSWDNGTTTDVGAVTWGNGTTGVKGTVSVVNSLVGSTAGDLVGSAGITALNNGNYVVISPIWSGSKGAVTWGNGLSGTVGAVSSVNSLVGTASGGSTADRVGSGGVIALNNGNYVVISTSWRLAGSVAQGAVTWGNGTTGVKGTVSADNSLVGNILDGVGSGGVTALSNGNYVVSSPGWRGIVGAGGAVTWGNGTTGVKGTVSADNSLVGSTAGDEVGSGRIFALNNGNYVVSSPSWNNGTTVGVGAVTWGNGAGGTVGPVSATNSLVGSQSGDSVGSVNVVALNNGNYVVVSSFWDNGPVVSAGAATWGNGLGGTVGVVSAANSLVGSTQGDSVGSFSVVALSNGNYAVASHLWDNGPLMDVGAVTWGNGVGGTVGPISAANSLVGRVAGDQVGYPHLLTALSDGNYLVRSSFLDNGAMVDAGAVTLGKGGIGHRGAGERR